MSLQITTDFLAFVNQTNLDLTREIQDWTLTDPKDKELIETALTYAGGTFKYIDQVIEWLVREVPRIEIIRTGIRDLLRQKIRTEEFAEELSRPEKYQEYTRILEDSIDVLKFIRRKRLAETKTILIRAGGIRPLIKNVETAAPRTYRRFLSSYGDNELDKFIEDDIIDIVNQIYKETRLINPRYRIRYLRLEYFPAKPLAISRLPEETIYIDNPRYSEFQYDSDGRSLRSSSSPETSTLRLPD